MNRQTKTALNNLGTLAEEAMSLLTATADVAGEKVIEARKRLIAALDDGTEVVGRLRDKAIDQGRAADQTIRDYPYQSIAIGVGVGALLGYLLAKGCSRNGD